MSGMKTIILVIALALMAENTFAQHQHMESPTPTPHVHDHNAMPTTSPTPDNSNEIANMPRMNHGDHEMKMASTVNIGDPMAREASGTSWNPDSSPMYAWMKHYENGGMLM